MFRLKLCIVGGALQGMEAAYLAKKAGYETVIIDRRADAPAMSLADSYTIMDVAADVKGAARIFGDCDAVIPACENMDTLISLDSVMASLDTPFLFDMPSYKVSSSKNLSNRMMERIGIPIPKEWPECGYPAVIKPSSQSGSIGVSIVNDDREAEAAISAVRGMDDEYTAQEFVSGRNVSMEVIGDGNGATSYATTEIILDSGYDCKRVVCMPGILNDVLEERLRTIGENIAREMRLNSIMDVEAIDAAKGLRVLEIDARIPSQTPAAVLAATGVNLLEEMVNRKTGKGRRIVMGKDASSYEHFTVIDGVLMTNGEKQFSKVRSPSVIDGLFGADVFIAEEPNGNMWRGTMINSAVTEEKMESKRERCIQRMIDELNVKKFIDSAPGVIA